MRSHLLAFACCAACLGSCGQKSEAPTSPLSSDGAGGGIFGESASSVLRHNYVEREGGAYYYVTAVSEEDKKKGVGTGAVIGFRFSGISKDGIYYLEQLSDNGRNVSSYSCSKPCVIIKQQSGGRIAFNPDSVIGSAFVDALSGQLEIDKRSKISAKAQASSDLPTSTSGVPRAIGDCVTTAISSIGTRLEDTPGSGTAIAYRNKIYGVDYSTVQEVEASKVGDLIKLCLVSLPKHCPPGDERGRVYSATNLRTKATWTLPDSEHMCGGA